jgi:hypothetical protein
VLPALSEPWVFSNGSARWHPDVPHGRTENKARDSGDSPRPTIEPHVYHQYEETTLIVHRLYTRSFLIVRCNLPKMDALGVPDSISALNTSAFANTLGPCSYRVLNSILVHRASSLPSQAVHIPKSGSGERCNDEERTVFPPSSSRSTAPVDRKFGKTMRGRFGRAYFRFPETGRST